MSISAHKAIYINPHVFEIEVVAKQNPSYLSGMELVLLGWNHMLISVAPFTNMV